MALATTVRKKLFTQTERENGKAAWVLGASFISEGAIPFAAADPLRVIPASMAGGAVTGALSMAFGATLRAPHGGIFVVPLIGNPFLYLIAIAAGVCVTTGPGRRPEEHAQAGPGRPRPTAATEAAGRRRRSSRCAKPAGRGMIPAPLGRCESFTAPARYVTVRDRKSRTVVSTGPHA